MQKAKKIKIYLGFIYTTVILLFLWVFFSNFSLNDLTSYEFIKNNMNYLYNIKEKNYLILSLLFIFFTVIWVFLLGFASPIILLGGFIFGKWIGTILVVFSMSVGATLLYIFANYFFKDLIIKKFSKKYIALNNNFKKNEFLFFLIYRFIGGIPFFLSNLLPILFNIKLKNFFFGTLIGMTPQLFVGVALASGVEKIINENNTLPSFFDILSSKDIYYPLLAFILLLIVGLIIKKRIYKK